MLLLVKLGLVIELLRTKSIVPSIELGLIIDRLEASLLLVIVRVTIASLLLEAKRGSLLTSL